MSTVAEELIAEWQKDCTIDQTKLGEESIRSAILHAKYLSYLVNARQRLIKAQHDLNAMRALRTRYYSGEMTKAELQSLGWEQYQGLKPLKSEMTQRLDQDDEVMKLAIKLRYLETIVETIESIMQQIKSRDWAIRNAIEWYKIQHAA